MCGRVQTLVYVFLTMNVAGVNNWLASIVKTQLNLATVQYKGIRSLGTKYLDSLCPDLRQQMALYSVNS
jgi:hypothetical protein